MRESDDDNSSVAMVVAYDDGGGRKMLWFFANCMMKNFFREFDVDITTAITTTIS